MPVCFFMVAVPASGKTTLVNNMLKESPNLKVVSLDKYIEAKMKELNKNYGDIYFDKDLMKECEKKYKEELTQILDNKEDFIWDQMNLSESSRKSKLARLHSQKYEVIALEFSITYEEWKKRIDSRNENYPEKKFSTRFYEDMWKAFEEVRENENFQDVFMVMENGELKKKFSSPLEKKFK